MSTHSTLKKQAGMFLLEGLIAILIFSLGVLAIVGMQMVAVKQVTDAKFRTDACLLANELLGTMWASDRKTSSLQTNFNTGGTGYTAWLANVAATLPGVAANPPTVVVGTDGTVTVTVLWIAPTDAATAIAHKYVAVAQISK